MPKENTHIMFINDIVNSLQCDETRNKLQSNYEALCFGCVMADTFFYSSNKDIVNISEKLHGKDGENTNELTFDLLDRARQYKSEHLLCLSIGYISHCVFDIIFHPVIYSLAGNYYDENASIRKQAIYNHRLLETRLDNNINNRYYLDKILSVNDKLIHEVLDIISVKYKFTSGDLIKAYKKQLFGNKCFRNSFTHRIVYQLNKLKILNLENILPLFYNHLHIDDMELNELDQSALQKLASRMGKYDPAAPLVETNKKIQETIKKMIQNIKDGKVGIGTASLNYLDDMIKHIEEGKKNIDTKSKGMLDPLVAAIKSGKTTLNIVSYGILTGVLAGIDADKKSITTKSKGMMDPLVEAIKQGKVEINAKSKNYLDEIIANINAGKPNLNKASTGLFTELISQINTMTKTTNDSVNSMLGTLLNSLDNTAEKINTTSSLLGGLLGGMTGMSTNLNSINLSGYNPLAKIPAHAAGGITTGGHVAMVGEAGPEAIIPLNSSFLQNLSDQIASKIGTSMLMANNMNSNNNQSSAQNITIELDKQKIGKILAPQIQKENQRINSPLVTVK